MAVSINTRLWMLIVALGVLVYSIVILIIIGPGPEAYGIVLVSCVAVLTGTFVDWLHGRHDKGRRYELEVQVDSIVKIRFEIWAKDTDDLTTKLRDDFQDVFDSYQLAAQFIDITK